METTSTQLTTPPTRSLTGSILKNISVILLVAVIVGGFAYYKQSSRVVRIEDSLVSAPAINLGSNVPGTLTEVYVEVGDSVLPNTPLARVGNNTITAQVAGVVTAVDRELGKTFNPGQTVVSMINPLDLRIVGKIDEDKGLTDIAVGAPATFTVDAFGSQVFTGVVDKISPTADTSGVSFSLSSSRPTQQFGVSVLYGVASHPEFKNGMSARITVYR